MNLEAQLDGPCDIITRGPDRRTGPLLLRFAVRCIVDHRPLAEEVEIRMGSGEVMGEAEIEALYALARLPASAVDASVA